MRSIINCTYLRFRLLIVVALAMLLLFVTQTAHAHSQTSQLPVQTPNIWKVQVNASGQTAPFETIVGYNARYKHLKALHKLGIQTIRTHDIGQLDWIQMFPNWNADPNEPSSYDFKKADHIMKMMMSQGFVPFLRIGTSWSAPDHHPYKGVAIDPPNVKKFAIIATHIVGHYVNGWDHGFHFPIHFVEIWNEPDPWAKKHKLSRFWHGTPEHFYKLCAASLKAIKTAFPQISVGACGATFPNRAVMTKNLIIYLHKHHAPLDFFSWHIYENNPIYVKGTDKSTGVSMFLRFSKLIRKELDQYGYPCAKSICSEWNSGPRSLPDIMERTLNTLMVAENQNMAATLFYPIHTISWTKKVPIWKKSPKAWAFRAFKVFKSVTSLRIPASGSRGVTSMVMAATSNTKGTVQVLLSSMASKIDEVRLRVSGLTSGTALVKWLALNNSDHLSVTQSNTILVPSNGIVELDHKWKSPGIMLVRLVLQK